MTKDDMNSAAQVYKNSTRAAEDEMVRTAPEASLPELERRVIVSVTTAINRVCMVSGVKPAKLARATMNQVYQNMALLQVGFIFKVFGRADSMNFVPEIRAIIDQDPPPEIKVPAKHLQISTILVLLCTNVLHDCGVSRKAIVRYMGCDMQLREIDKAIGRIMELFGEKADIDPTRGGKLPAMPAEMEDELTAASVAMTATKETN